MSDAHRTVKTDPPLAVSQTDALRATACPRCEYPRPDNAHDDICTECGWKYNDTVLVLVGRGRGRFDTLAGGTWRGVIITAALVVMFAFMWKATMFWTIVFGVMLLAQLAAIFLSPMKPTMQLWLSEIGFAEIPSTTEARIAQFIVENIYWFALPLSILPAMLRRPHTRQSWIIVLSLFALMCATSFILMVRHEPRRRFREPSADDMSWLHPWEKAMKVTLSQLDSSKPLRIRIRGMKKWGFVNVSQLWLVDFDWTCTPEQRRALQQGLEKWSRRIVNQ